MTATIRDVAKYAKVGIATVSRVLNNHPAVSEETRTRVLAAIKELNYKPNLIARQLSLGKTQTIGVILPYLTLPSYVERLRGIQSVLDESNYDLILFVAETPEKRDAFFERLADKSRVDGLIIMSLPPTDEQTEKFIREHQSVVLIDAYHPKLCSIIVNDIQGGSLATRHLIELGHRKIAYISDYLTTPFYQSMRYRYLGYREALDQEHIPYIPAYHIQGDQGRLYAQHMTKQLLALEDPPTAIFAASDSHAIGVMDVAREYNLKVPEELSVIGYDGIRDAEYVNLTTVEQNLFESGVEGASMLLSMIQSGSNEPCKIELSIKLTIRNTTAAPSR